MHEYFWHFFFFQAEDGIRDYKVTGVQTCALPILWGPGPTSLPLRLHEGTRCAQGPPLLVQPLVRSEAVRRVRRGDALRGSTARPHRRPAVLQLRREPPADLRRHLRKRQQWNLAG